MFIGHTRYRARVILDEVLQGCRRSSAVEGAPTIGQENDRNSTRPQDTMDFHKEAQRICEVLKHVARDHEVEAARREHVEPVDVEIADHVGLGEFCLG
jgi:hypothetical protein